jgi:hypothetical protein
MVMGIIMEREERREGWKNGRMEEEDDSVHRSVAQVMGAWFLGLAILP